MAAQVLSKNCLKRIFYAPSMNTIVSKLKLLSRSLTSMSLQNKLGETSRLTAPGNWPHEPDFPLPGNVAVDVANLYKEQPAKKEEKFQSLASALLQLENETFRKHQVLSQFVAEKMEEDIQIPTEETNKVECKIQSCPQTLKKGFQDLFSNIPDSCEDFTIITISQRTSNDMSTWSEEVEEERDTLTEAFIANAKEICHKVKEGGYWADFVDPSSGKAFYSEHRNETLFETDDRFNQLGFQVEDLGCCKVLMHKHWKSNVFAGVIFTNAPVESHVFDNM